MYANNEVGTIEPVKEIADICHAHGVTFFTDAVQAAGALPINVKEIGCDLLSASGHKIHAPKGIGILYVKKGTRLANLIDGGGQERSKRSGTENIPEIVGLAKAFELSRENMKNNDALIAKRDRLIKEILTIPDSFLTVIRPTDSPATQALFSSTSRVKVFFCFSILPAFAFQRDLPARQSRLSRHTCFSLSEYLTK